MQGSGGSDDELDDVLDGRTDQYADELAPMVATARLLRDATQAHELGPEVAARHIQMALARAELARARVNRYGFDAASL